MGHDSVGNIAIKESMNLSMRKEVFYIISYWTVYFLTVTNSTLVGKYIVIQITLTNICAWIFSSLHWKRLLNHDNKPTLIRATMHG